MTMRILALAGKDIKQLFQSKQTAFFLLLMPVMFTLMFGFMFGGFSAGSEEDPRLPVGVLDLDQTTLSETLIELVDASAVIRPVVDEEVEEQELRALVDKGDLAGAVIIPAGFGNELTVGELPTMVLVADENSLSANITVENAVMTAYNRLYSAALSAGLSQQSYLESSSFDSQEEQQVFFAAAIDLALDAWQSPPVAVKNTQVRAESTEEEEDAFGENAFSHSSPGMMAQFAIAGLIGAAEMLVSERRSRTMSRMLTTRISRTEVLFGHFLAIFTMIFLQLLVLVIFGQLFLKLNYFGQSLATLGLITATSMVAGALGLLIGALAKTSDQAVIFSLVPMFIFAGLGGAWVPLEFTNAVVQTISKFTPVAWTMQGFKDILLRGAHFADLVPALLALGGFTVVFFGLAVWRFRFEGE
jgi:ABC-2 type transport system permease protein